MQACDERQECIVQLAAMGDVPQAELLDQRASMAHSFFAPNSKARGLTSLVDGHPSDLLTLLDTAIATQNDIPLLYDWAHDCRSWQAVLISEVYGRMFQPALLTIDEATCLADKMLSALRAFPSSTFRDTQEALYETLRQWLKGTFVTPPPVPTPSASPIERSHALAVQCLRQAQSRGKLEVTAGLLDVMLGDRRGWWETTQWKLQNGGLSQGFGLYLIYVFPAVRVALASIAQHYGATDPAGSLMEARTNAAKAIHDHHSVLVGRDTRPEQLERALTKLESHSAPVPHHEGVLSSCGNLLLRLGRVDRARSLLERSLALPTCVDDSRAIALYDLACVGPLRSCGRLPSSAS